MIGCISSFYYSLKKVIIFLFTYELNFDVITFFFFFLIVGDLTEFKKKICFKKKIMRFVKLKIIIVNNLYGDPKC